MVFTLPEDQPEPASQPWGEARPVLSLLPPHRNGLDDATLCLATWLIDRSGVVKVVVKCKAAECRGPGGRPETFPYRALLIAMAACVLTDQPLYLSRVCELMFVQLSPEWRRRLGIPEPLEGDEAARENLYRNVRTRFHGLLDLMDPSPTPKNRRLDDATLTRLTEQRRAERTEEEWDERYRRLEWFINQLIEATIMLLPREVRRSMGSLGVDGTLVKAHSRPYKRKKGDKPKKGKRPAIEVHSVDPDAGFYVRQADSRDENPDGVGKDKIAWGFEATFGVSGSPDLDNSAYPNLIVAMGVLDKPGQSPGKHGAQVLASLHERGHQPGLLAADRAFSSAKPRTSNCRPSPSGIARSTTTKSTSSGCRPNMGASSRSRAPGTARRSPNPSSMPPWTTGKAASTSACIGLVWRSAGNTWPVRRGSPTTRAMCASSAQPPTRGR